MTRRTLFLALALVGACDAPSESAPVQDVPAVKEWSGTITVSESGTISSSASQGTRSAAGKLSVSRSCSGPLYVTGGDGYGNWSGEAELSCSINDGFEHKVDNANPRHEVHHVNTQQKQAGGSETVSADLSIDLERGTYSINVSSPSLETTELLTSSDGHTSSSSTSSSSEYVFNLMRSSLVEDQPLAGAGTSLSGSISEPADYFLPVGNEPSGAVQRTISWSLAPGRREKEKDVQIAIAGPACSCMHAEDAEGKPLFFTATASVPGGTFGSFEVRSAGEAPREIVNEGGASPRLELAGTPRTGKVTLSIAYMLDGRRYTASGFSVSFCALEAISVAGGGKDFSFDDSSPGRIAVNVSGQAWLNGEPAADQLSWSLEQMGQGTKRVPEEETGASVELAYEGLPEWNGALGEKAVTARVEKDGCDCERTETIRAFYPMFESNHPHADDGPGTTYGDTPNWYYYWTQTAAQQEIGMAFLRYHGGGLADKQGNVVAARYDENTDKVILTDEVLLRMCQSRVGRTTGKPTGETSEGIDCFAETLIHEWQHRTDWNEWWPGGAPGIWKGMLVDNDVDYVPASVEEKLPGCSDSSNRSCDGLPAINGITDREINAYWAGWAWPIGSADEEDWACNGKQWDGGTCP